MEFPITTSLSLIVNRNRNRNRKNNNRFMARFGVWQIAINARKIQEWNFDCPNRNHNTQPDDSPSLSFSLFHLSLSNLSNHRVHFR